MKLAATIFGTLAVAMAVEETAILETPEATTDGTWGAANVET